MQALPTFSFESSALLLYFSTQKEQIQEIPQDQLLLSFHTVGGVLSMATHCCMGRCKLACLPCQLWKQKPALINAATTLTLPLEKHSMALEKPALLQCCFHQMDTGTTENSLSTWNMSIANISFRCLSISSFHPPAETKQLLLFVVVNQG